MALSLRSARPVEQSASMCRWLGRMLAIVAMALASSSCRTLEFYGGSAVGQLEILRRSRPISKVLADPGTAPELRRKLSAVQEMREFASARLALPGDESFGTYADLGRDHVTWVLYAAPEFSMTPKSWRYPMVGELEYRGFFREDHARRLANQLEARGYDVDVSGVDAYSTLGWFHDPVLNTFVSYPDVALAELIFHELTHRRLFRHGDTGFNESLATAVAEEGVIRWLRHHQRSEDLARYQELLVRRDRFYGTVDRTHARLKALYVSGLSESEMRREKKDLLARLQADFREMRRRWGGRGLESWLTHDLNNAHLVSIIIYQRGVRHFRDLLKESGGDLETFFRKAESAEVPTH